GVTHAHPRKNPRCFFFDPLEAERTQTSVPGTRRYVIPLVIVFLLVGVIWAGIAVQGIDPRLASHRRGGATVPFPPTNPRGGEPTKEQLDTTVDIIRNRVNSKGVAESEVSVEGGNIVVSIPNVPNPDEVID